MKGGEYLSNANYGFFPCQITAKYLQADMETENNLLSGKSCYILFDTMGSAWLSEHVEYRGSWQVVLVTGETDVPVAVDQWLLPFVIQVFVCP